jgi:hypothetical protein
MKTRWLFALALVPALACSKQATQQQQPPPPPFATGLDYQDPQSSGWRLVRDPSSTTQRLLLNLVGPAGLKSRGVGFNLRAPDAIHFVTFDETRFPLRDKGVYELLNYCVYVPSDPYCPPTFKVDPQEPVLLAGAVQAGNKLTVGLFQKDRRPTAKDSGVPLLQIGLELAASSAARSGDEIQLVIPKSQFMAEDIGAFSPSPTPEMARKAHLQNMTIAVGSLHAN